MRITYPPFAFKEAFKICVYVFYIFYLYREIHTSFCNNGPLSLLTGSRNLQVLNNLSQIMIQIGGWPEEL